MATLLTLFVLIIIFPERNNLTRFYVLPIWIAFVLLFSVVLSKLLVLSPDLPFFYLIMTLHHLLITIIVIMNQQYTLMIQLANILISIPGLLILNIVLLQEADVQMSFVLSVHYFLTNIYYGILIEYFEKYAALKFWRRRKGLNTVIIFVIGNLSLLSLVILVFYAIAQIPSHWRKGLRRSELVNLEVNERKTNYTRNTVQQFQYK